MLETTIYDFLVALKAEEKALSLAFSGGPDSTALLHLLLPFQGTLFKELHLIHVDHCWRKESSFEANQLEKLAVTLSLPFHLLRLNPADFEGNMEDFCRKRRMEFFLEVQKKTASLGVFVAHTRGDQAETLLKQLLEAARFDAVKSMPIRGVYGELQLFRPLLNRDKKELLAWLESKQITYFQDPTNQDTRFLRAKMRLAVLPFLEEQFGKNVSSSLIQLGDEAEEIQQFLLELVEPYMVSQERRYDFSLNFPEKKLLKRVLLRYLFQREGFYASQAMISTAIELIEKKAINKKLCSRNLTVLFDRGKLIFTS